MSQSKDQKKKESPEVTALRKELAASRAQQRANRFAGQRKLAR